MNFEEIGFILFIVLFIGFGILKEIRSGELGEFLNFMKMMKIVIDAGYHGYVGIEWEGGKPGELEGIKLTKKLLETCRDKLSGA